MVISVYRIQLQCVWCTRSGNCRVLKARPVGECVENTTMLYASKYMYANAVYNSCSRWARTLACPSETFPSGPFNLVP